MAQWREWREHAACDGMDTEIFFPVGSGARAARQAALARSICRTCPVIERCAETAITYGYEGIWGGLDDDERRWLRRGRTGAAVPLRRRADEPDVPGERHAHAG